MAATDEEWADRLRETLRWSHEECTDDCMSDQAERFRAGMNAGAVAANHRLHMADVAMGLEAAVADGLRRSKER